jgi:diguanylate cyclase (GGDEF)-like protein
MGWLRDWPVWALPPRLRRYVLTVICAGAAATVAAGVRTPWRAHDALVCGVLLAIGAITVESVRRMGEPALAGKDAHGIWELAIALLLPPFYALAAPAAVYLLIQWRVRRTLAHRRAFSAAAIGLSNGAASLVFHAGWHHHLIQHRLASWLLLAFACAVLRWALNHVLVVTAIKLDDPGARLRDLTGGPVFAVGNDAGEMCLGILVAWCATTSLIVPVIALPWAVLLERAVRGAQLRQATRTDPATQLLTGPAWRREATVAVIRARQAGTPLAVAIIDVDHLGRLMDMYGPLLTDSVMYNVAQLLTVGMRDGDLPGRLGDQELTVLIPRADAGEAVKVAERLQAMFRLIALPADTVHGVPPHVTTSIGLASMSTATVDLTDLLAAADTALVRAKRAGCDTIRVADQPGPA